MTEEREVAIQIIGCMVDALADEKGNIDQRCFEKIFNACIKSVIAGARVGDQALMTMQQATSKVTDTIWSMMAKYQIF